nr:hypothetical protein [Prevotella sp.]
MYHWGDLYAPLGPSICIIEAISMHHRGNLNAPSGGLLAEIVKAR